MFIGVNWTRLECQHIPILPQYLVLLCIIFLKNVLKLTFIGDKILSSFSAKSRW